MGTVTFTHQLGMHVPAGSVAIPSSNTLDHAVSIAKQDAKAQTFQGQAAHAHEISALYNATVKDGRFIEDLPHDPEGVAKKLNLQISKGAAAEIKKAGGLQGAKFQGTGGTVAGTVTVVCIAVVVVLCADTGPNTQVVVDRSGMIKF